MRCEQARRELLGGPAEPLGAAVSAHLVGCEACSQLHLRRRSLDTLLDRHADPEPGPGFDTRFFARLEGERARAGRGRFVRWAFALVPAAAAVAIASFQELRRSFRKLDTLSAAERRRFLTRLQRWRDLSPEQRERVRKRIRQRLERKKRASPK